MKWILRIKSKNKSMKVNVYRKTETKFKKQQNQNHIIAEILLDGINLYFAAVLPSMTCCRCWHQSTTYVNVNLNRFADAIWRVSDVKDWLKILLNYGTFLK